MKIYNLGSLNIDYVYNVDHFVRAGETLSSDNMSVFPGGKGLNQSVALSKAGAQVLHGAVIGENCIVAAGALVPQGMVIPDGSLVIGSPAKVRRQLTDEEIAANRHSAEGYVHEAAEYKAFFSK